MNDNTLCYKINDIYYENKIEQINEAFVFLPSHSNNNIENKHVYSNIYYELKIKDTNLFLSYKEL